MVTITMTTHCNCSQIQREISKCTCSSRFKVEQIGEGKYRVSELFSPMTGVLDINLFIYSLVTLSDHIW